MTVRRRCAIYTRKSTEDGLDQAFNSLDAQREACAAYVLSQAGEGWELINEQYDDGGWSGGNMARPGLKQLLSDVEAGKVDVIVVYKVDRLTRSLADFARIVDTLDKAGASFVSVTQAFNTTSSMGRLTLNVLLSFAQFEREVTSERIRDKVAASKRKGMWMGGPIPIGYRLADRKLLPEEGEAKIVLGIFERYAALRSINALVYELAHRDVRTKVRAFRDGRVVGGIPFTTGPLAALIKNPVYIGKVAHKGALYDGEHEAIVDQKLWDEVQSILATNRCERQLGKNARYPSLLTGLLGDPEGRPMSPTFASKGSQRHHYYFTRLKPGEDRATAWRVPAGEIDRAVLDCLTQALQSQADSRAIETGDCSHQHETVGEAFSSKSVPELRAMLLERNVAVQLMADQLVVRFGPGDDMTSIKLPACLAHKGGELKLVVPVRGTEPARSPDPVLLKLVVLAHTAQQADLKGEDDELVDRYSTAHYRHLLRISWLAPDILAAIVEGRQPVTLTGRRLLRVTNLPLEWAAQRKLLGFA